MASGNVKHYLGRGTAATRPGTLSLAPGTLGLWLSTDSGEWSAWDGSAWRENIMAAGDGPPTTYTASTVGVLTDKVVRMNSASEITYTIPTNANVPHKIGTVLELWQMGVGTLTIAAAGGVQVRVREGLTLKAAGQIAGVSARKMGTNEWYVIGDLQEVTP